MEAPVRLSPTMASRKIQVLGFIRRYIAEHGESPSYGEMAAALDTNKARISAVVHVLTEERQIYRIPGAHRGITLPGDIETAVRLLRAQGIKVDDDVFGSEAPVTNPSLPRIPALAHIPDFTLGGEHHDHHHESAG